MRDAAHNTLFHGITWGGGSGSYQDATPSIGQDCLNAASGLSFIERAMGAILGAYDEA